MGLKWDVSNLMSDDVSHRYSFLRTILLLSLLTFIDYHIDSYRVEVTFYLFFNKNLAVNLLIPCKPQFFIAMHDCVGHK